MILLARWDVEGNFVLKASFRVGWDDTRCVVPVASAWSAWCLVMWRRRLVVLLQYLTLFLHSLHIVWLMSNTRLPGACKNSKCSHFFALSFYRRWEQFFTVSFHVYSELNKLPPNGFIVHCTIGDVLFSKQLSQHLMPYRYRSICIDACISKEDVTIYCHIDILSTALAACTYISLLQI